MLREISKMITANDGSRTLVESIMANDVTAALEAWTKAVWADEVLVGGLAYSFYAKPQVTQEVDFCFGRPQHSGGRRGVYTISRRSVSS
jgi:hypothetical protein